MVEISETEWKILGYLSLRKGDDYVSENDIVIHGVDAQSIRSALSWLERKGLIDALKKEELVFVPTSEGRSYIKGNFPEEEVLDLMGNGDSLSVVELMKAIGTQRGKIALAQLAKFSIKPVSGIITIRNKDSIRERILRYREALVKLSDGKTLSPGAIDILKARGNIIAQKRVSTRFVRINNRGREYLQKSYSSGAMGELSRDVLQSNSWRNLKFRRYDVTSAVSPLNAPFLHPLTILIDKVRSIFFDLGFTEMTGSYVESSLWNMDALFIPQDHTARDMQDTFYVTLDKPPHDEEENIKKIVSQVHEHGYGRYSGWGYEWNEAEASKLLLRTHTTVSTARYLHSHRDPPVAVFSVEKVFRHESVDWKHLAEFHQIEGALYSSDANLATLKWLLKEFYGRLGFDEIKLIPSYYPYTEPSMDVVVRFEGKEVELGGSGVFRPEVERILGLKTHAIAWGLGLERLAFLYYGLEDVREIYNTDIEFLRRFRIIR